MPRTDAKTSREAEAQSITPRNVVEDEWGISSGGVIHSGPYAYIHTIYVERKYIYTHTNTFCTVAIFGDLKYSFLKKMSWAKSLISLTRIIQTR